MAGQERRNKDWNSDNGGGDDDDDDAARIATRDHRSPRKSTTAASWDPCSPILVPQLSGVSSSQTG